MIKKINNTPGNADTIKVITDKCNDNFELLESLIPNVEDILKKKEFITSKDVKTTFSFSDIIGLEYLISQLTSKIESLEQENAEIKNRLSVIDLDNYNIAKSVLDSNRLISELKR